MSALSPDTIAAIATPAGRGGIGVIRISGGQARKVAAMVAGDMPPPRQAALRSFRNREKTIVDRGLLLYFPAPHSFTGEDVVELHAHGSPVALAELLETLCATGARIARPGEFSERAFLNGCIDLAQAEAVADLIDAGSRSAARAAARTLQGEFSQRVFRVVEALTELRTLIEAALDFADEDVPAAAAPQVDARLGGMLEELAAIERAAAQGRRLRDGLSVAIAGRPNVGKSSLLNRLAGVEAAIVSPQAGTTRDVLRENIVVAGLPLTIADTAGLRDSADPIEREGVRRAQLEAARAELVLYVVDDSGGVLDEDKVQLQRLADSGIGVVVVRNKCDLGSQAPGLLAADDGVEALRVSAATGAGLDALISHIKRRAGLSEEAVQAYSARARHLEALRAAQAHIESARVRADDAVLVAEELRLAQAALQAITGKFTSDDLLGRIFASFCLGK